jgi:hypothetical protein
MSAEHWILVDYENVQDLDLKLVAGHPVRVVLFIGQNQRSVPVDLLSKILMLKEQVVLVQSAGTGRNALDFQMCFHAGHIAACHPDAFIHMVSKDKGFGVLVKHMKDRNLFAEQVGALSEIKFLPPKADSKSIPAAERTPYAAERIRRQTPASRPRKRRTLASSVAAMFGKRLSTPEVDAVVEQLISSGIVSIAPNDAVTYLL